MQIAIIGGGDVGRVTATSRVRAGRSVVLSARDTGHARDAAAQVGAGAAGSGARVVTAFDTGAA